MPLPPLTRLRLRLTAWYAVTLGAILLLLGGGLFVAIRSQIATQLDASLRDATRELARAAQIREMEAKSAQGAVVDAVDELRIPDRTLYLLGTDGRAIKPEHADAWIVDAARAAAEHGSVDREHRVAAEDWLRLHAETVRLDDGETVVVAAVANKVELEDRYSSLIAAFGGAAAGALVLIAAGGWFLVRKSTAPVERTIEYMRRFMADAAHELRTPLTVLRSRAEIALQKPRDAEGYAEALRGVESESKRLGRIVDDLLTLARADTGERPIARERVFLDDIAVDAASAAQAMANAKSVRLDVEEFDEAPVSGDAALLRQLVMILLDNAIKFTPSSGRVAVRVGAQARRASLVVEDTGIGIAAEALPHVFERFYRADPARSSDRDHDASGAGLGLSIARWIADAHGAVIALEARGGAGTRATVTFPTPDDAPSDGAAERAAPHV